MKRLSISGALVIAAGLATLSGPAHAALIAGWDFQTTTTGGTAVVAWNAETFPRVFQANFGQGRLYLDGTNGSSSWELTDASNTTELNAFSGSTVNAGEGFSTVTAGQASLALVNQTANGKSAVFAFSMAGFSDLLVTYASQRTATGFTTQQWDASTNGVDWTPLETVLTPPSPFGLVTLSPINALDNAATGFLRLTVTGNTSGSGNNRLDNIQLNATPRGGAIPEPGTFALLASGLLPAGLLLRRRQG